MDKTISLTWLSRFKYPSLNKTYFANAGVVPRGVEGGGPDNVEGHQIVALD